MCHFVIELQEKVRSQANFLELLENKTLAFIRNFGNDSAEVAEHLKTVTDYKIELILRERALEKQIASNNGVNLAEPSKLALLVNKAIDDINNLVKNGTIEDNLNAIATHIRDNEYSYNKAHSQVSQIVLSHFINVFEKPLKTDSIEVIEDNKDNNMLNKNNVIGAIVLLKHCHVMPNNTPLKVVDYSKGDGGTGYLPMIMVTDNKVFEWVRLKSVKTVLEVGQPFEDKQNMRMLLKQIKHFTSS